MAETSRYMFIAAGFVWLLIGLVTPFFMDTSSAKTTLFGSPTTDAALYGDAPEVILASNPELSLFRGMALGAIAGLLVGSGILVIGVAWFGLETPSNWALALLTVAGIVVIPYRWIIFAPYRSAGISLSIGALPPFMWIPSILMPLATVFGWIAVIRT